MANKLRYGDGSLTIRDRAKGKYYCLNFIVGYDVMGKAVRRTVGSYKKYEVYDKAKTAIAEFKADNIIYDDDASVGDMFKMWLFNFKKPSVSDTTFERYYCVYKLRLKDLDFALLNPSEVTPNDVRAYVDLIGKSFSRSCVEFSLCALKSFFRYCEGINLVLKNPCDFVKIDKDSKALMALKDIIVYSVDEQKALLGVIDFNNPIDLAIYLSLKAGLRLGEVLGLRWSDFIDNCIYIREQYRRTVDIQPNGAVMRGTELGELKTSASYGSIPLDPETLSVLSAFKVLSSANDDDLMFMVDNKPIERKRPARRLKKLCKLAGIEYKTFHALRRSFVTNLVNADINPKICQSLARHQSIETTMQFYAKSEDESKAQAIDKVFSERLS